MVENSRDFNMVTAFLLFCSGVSMKLIKQCPQYEINKYSSIGLTIVFTTLLSSLSAYFAFSLIFDSLFIVLGASLIWGGMIFNLDRYIVSTLRSVNSRKSEFLKAVPRLIIAVLIALVISKPIEIKLFKNEINTFLEKEKIAMLDGVKEKYAAPIATIAKRKDDLNSKLENKIAIREGYYADYKCECEGTCGTGKRGRGTECESRQEKYETYAAEVEIEKSQTNLLLTELNKERKSLLDQLEEESVIVSEEFEPGFFDRIRALNEIAQIASIFILSIFIMIEIAPILTKLLSTKGPYESLVEESELSYEMQLQKAKDDYDHERVKNKKLREVSFDLELENKQSELKKNLKAEAYARYEKMQQEINKNNHKST
jgi:signal transduction histidine kinase